MSLEWIVKLTSHSVVSYIIYHLSGLSNPLALQDFGRVAMGPLQYAVPLAVALSTFGSLNGLLFTSGRLFLAGAREHHMPQVLSYIDIKARTPKPALLLSCFLSLCLLGLDIIPLINCLSFALWLSIGAATAALLKFRMNEKGTRTDIPRSMMVPLVLPVVFLACCVYLVIVPLVIAPRSTGGFQIRLIF